MVSTTASVSSDDEELWRERLEGAFSGLHTRALTGNAEPTGELTARAFADIGVFELSGSSQTVYRATVDTRRSPAEFLKLSLQLSGRAVVSENGTDVEVGPGEFAVYDTSRAYALTLFGPWRTLVMTVPRTALPIPQRRLEQIFSRSFSARSGAGAMLTGYLRAGSGAEDTVSDIEAARIRDAGLSLLEGALAGEAPSLQDDTMLAVQSLAIEYIRTHCSDPDLTPGAVAAACHLSPRSLHRVFEGSGTSVAETIRRFRLEAVRRDLQNPLFGNLTIGAIAARWGITDSSWLSRSFRAEFGRSPSECRAET